MRLLSCERDVPLAEPMPPGLRLVPATPQLSYVRAFSPGKPTLRDWPLVPATSRLSCVRAFSSATLMPRDWQLVRATPRLSYVRASSPANQKLQGYWLGLAKSQLSSYGPF
jgi:hypothetical protein